MEDFRTEESPSLSPSPEPAKGTFVPPHSPFFQGALLSAPLPHVPGRPQAHTCPDRPGTPTACMHRSALTRDSSTPLAGDRPRLWEGRGNRAVRAAWPLSCLVSPLPPPRVWGAQGLASGGRGEGWQRAGCLGQLWQKPGWREDQPLPWTPALLSLLAGSLQDQ